MRTDKLFLSLVFAGVLLSGAVCDAMTTMRGGGT